MTGAPRCGACALRDHAVHAWADVEALRHDGKSYRFVSDYLRDVRGVELGAHVLRDHYLFRHEQRRAA